MAYSELPKLKKNGVSTTLSSGINDTDTTIPVTELSVFYDADSNLITKGIVIGYDNATETYAEEITITGASGTSGAGNLTGATRGINADGTIGAAKAHIATTNIAVMFSTGIYEQIRANDQVFATIPNKNKIINGNFAVNQEGVSGTVTLSAGEYGHDMWCGGSSGCTYTFASSGGVTTLTIIAGSLIQVIEGINLISDTYCLSWTGTAQGKIGAGSFSSSGVTGSVTGGSNLNIEFGTGTLAKVQFEQGSYPTAFEHQNYNLELYFCQRYFLNLNPTGVAYQIFGQGDAYNSTTGNIVINIATPMISIPTASLVGTADLQNGSNLIAVSSVGAVVYSLDTQRLLIQPISTGLTPGAIYKYHGGSGGAALKLDARLSP